MHSDNDIIFSGNRYSGTDVQKVVQSALSDSNIIKGLVTTVSDNEVNGIQKLMAAKALKDISDRDASLLLPYKDKIIKLAVKNAQNHICWFISAVLPRLNLNTDEENYTVEVLLYWLEIGSVAAQANILEGLYEIAIKNPVFRILAADKAEEFIINGTPATRSRAAKVLRMGSADNFV